MTTSIRNWWRNCALNTDSEILEIDRMEDPIAPIESEVSQDKTIRLQLNPPADLRAASALEGPEWIKQ
jgi:hypothetical protein